MKIVVGIDPSHSAENVVHLLRRLRFPDSEAIYASYAPYPVVPPPGLSSAPDELIQRILDEQRQAANTAMKEAMAGLEDAVPGDEIVFDIGDAANRLDELAEDRHADLVAIGSRLHSPIEAAILGSVGRGLTLNSKHSILVAKGAVAKEGALKAVFAYDGSPCCNGSLETFLRMRPTGIAHIDLVVANPADPGDSPVVSLFGEGAYYLGSEHRHDVMIGLARDAAVRLTKLGYEVRALCNHGTVADVIRGAAVDLDADLIIMGAQGHGWLERVLLGSHALQQVVDESRSVLLLRPTP